MEALDDPETWIRMDAISDRELWETRLHLKRKLVLYIMDRARQRWMQGGYHPIQAIASGIMLDPYALTIGFARRFATYKRADLVFHNLDRLLELINRPTILCKLSLPAKPIPPTNPASC